MLYALSPVYCCFFPFLSFTCTSVTAASLCSVLHKLKRQFVYCFSCRFLKIGFQSSVLEKVVFLPYVLLE